MITDKDIEKLKQVFATKDEFTGAKSDITELKSDVQQLKSDVKQLKSDVKQLKADVKQLKSDVKQLQIDVAQLKTSVNTLTNMYFDQKRQIEEMDVRWTKKFDALLIGMDKITDFMERKSQEETMLHAIVERHDRWITQLAQKTGTTLNMA